MADKPHILIAGAGIGGLTAALALMQKGFDVDIYEQAPELREIGAGFQVSANGTRVFYELGLGSAIDSIAWEPSGKEIRIWNTGQTWKLFDLGAESVERYGYPYLMFHRADLHDVLIDAVRAKKADAIHLSCTAAGCDQDGAKVRLLLEGGDVIEGDVLIGADGVHSAVRQTLFGPDDRSFSGLIAWRGVIDKENLPDEMSRPVGVNWVGPGGHVVHYFVRNGALLNFVGILEKSDWQVESWLAQGTVEECLADFDGWHEAIRDTIRNIQTPYKYALMRREPMESWTQGRISLMGDACHPMVPMLAQGAVMAIEDGMILARCLEAYGDDPEKALQRYEAARMERTARCIRGSNENADRFHNSQLADPAIAQKYVDTEWQADSVRERYDWLFTYDAASVEV